MSMTTTRRTGLAALALLLLCSAAWAQQKPFYLRNGDRVVFYGDSITDQRLYTTFAETFVVTRFPRLNITFVHSGWGGDRVTGGGGGPVDTRLERDVLAYRPTVMTIMLGMNDASYRPFDQAIFDTYARGYEHIVDRVEAAVPDIRITVIQPSPFDDVTRKPNFEPGYNSVLVRYGEFVRELGHKQGLNVADLNTPVVAMLRKANETDPELAAKLIADRVHPGPAGQLIMAEALLRAWGAPSVVSFVRITTNRSLPVVTKNTRVRDLRIARDRLTWTQTDNGLPMPVNMADPATALAVKSSDFVQALNEQTLKVLQLPAARYALKIDGEAVGAFTRDELAAGVNLAMLDTPMARQAAQVHALTLEHNNIHFKRWRQVQVPAEKNPVPDLKRQLDDLDEQEAAIVRQQREAAQPKPHAFELLAE